MTDGIPMGRARVKAEEHERWEREQAELAKDPDAVQIPIAEADAVLFPILTNAQAALLAGATFIGRRSTGDRYTAMDTAESFLRWLDRHDQERSDS